MPTRDSIAKTARITGEDWKTLTDEMERLGVTFSGLVKEYAEILRRKKSGDTKEGVPEVPNHVRELQKICNKQRKEIAALEKELDGLKKPGKEKSDNSESVERLQAELSAVRSENEWLVCRIRELENAAPIDKGWEGFDTCDLTELKSMALASGMTLDGLLSEFRAKLESGEIGIGVYGLSVGTVDECPFDWRMFTNACDEMSYDYNEAMKKLIPMLFRV